MENDPHFYAVIMAGGGGTRLWPLSRKVSPKQMLNLFEGGTLFQIAIDRLQGLFDFDHIFIVTVAEQVEKLRELSPQIPIKNFLIEPMPRGTAAVVGMAAGSIKKKDPEAIMCILTADHFIQNINSFQNLLLAAREAAKTGVLVTLGIHPTFPATGYGYIESGELVGQFQGQEVFKVNAFIEKPSELRAVEFLKKEIFNWNSGMFIWHVDAILNEIKQYMSTLFGVIEELSPLLGVDHSAKVFIEKWDSINPQTIDYGIMEKSGRVVVLPASDLGWNDVGSWDSLFDVIPPDLNGNIVLNAQHIGMETRDSLILSTSKERLVVTLGLQNMIIIDTADALMVCSRGETQKVKELVQFLKDNQYTHFL
ncbi:MAG: sugar phosphate nucleotidyltransferase [Chloroflexi bacterium]|nr:sugar phosphate nucleotidyltransferase [Chloroflexota bacterium]